MYNQTYEEYMRNVLGYIPSYQDMEYTYRNQANMNHNIPTNDTMNYANSAEVESMYPDIYRIVYPMVKKACGNCQEEITQEIVESITMEIFTNVEMNMETETQITIQNRQTEPKPMKKLEENRNKTENRNRNFLLKDLIQILVLRELLGRPRSNVPGIRPPFPGRPGMHPPFMRGTMEPSMYGENKIFY